MNWEEYQAAKLRLIGDSSRPTLFMCGVMFDNGTRYLLQQKGLAIHNQQDEIFNGHHHGDFVWNGRTVRVFNDFESGGHPALAGLDSVCCAGRIEEDHFFFHSGHFHPKQEHAIHFFCDFIENTCKTLHGEAKDEKVDELSKIALRIYANDSEVSTYTTTFAELAQPKIIKEDVHPVRSFGASAPIKIGSSAPIKIGSSSRLPPKSEPRVHELGITPHGRHLASYRVERAANWIPDSERIRCAGCNQAFNLFRRKHHCRQCGDIFCDDCSKKTKALSHPARKDANDNGAGPYRVCDNCFTQTRII
jgi:hypothetical protein